MFRAFTSFSQNSVICDKVTEEIMGTEIAMSEHLTQPGETGGWPKLKVSYRTDPEKIAALLPPGLEPSGDPSSRSMCTVFRF